MNADFTSNKPTQYLLYYGGTKDRFVFEQSIVFHNAAVQNIYNLKTSSMRIFNVVKGIGFIVDGLFGIFSYQILYLQ